MSSVLTNALTWIRRLRETFWFLPAVMVSAAVLLAEGVVALDRFVLGGTDPLAVFSPMGATGARGILAAIGGSMLTVAATSFSITISVIATASSTYGPRLVRNFMADRGNQFVLGVFTATFVYALLALRSVRSVEDGSTGEAFVPHVAVYLAIVLAIINVGVLVFFIHHIATSVRVSSLIKGARDEVFAAIDARYPRQHQDDAVHAPSNPTRGFAVAAAKDGFVDNIYVDHLVGVAAKADGLIEVLVRTGDHVVEGEALARLRLPDGSHDADDALCKSIRRGISLATTRSPSQDIRFSLALVTEMAVRALSPGTNDPYTANNAIAELASALVRLAYRPQALPGRTRDGQLRLYLPVIDHEDLLDDVFTDLRIHGAAEPTVVRSTLQLAGRIAQGPHEKMAGRAREHATRMMEAFEGADPHPYDVARMRRIAAEELGEQELGQADQAGAS